MRKLYMCILITLLIFAQSGCKTTQETDKNSFPENIIKKDFDIEYNGVIINDIVSFKHIADELKIPLGKTDDNIEIKAMSSVGNNDYSWYVVYYPSKEDEDLRIEYILNETLKTEYLVYVDIFNAKTFRGIKVGDELKKLTSYYGVSVEPEYNTSKTVCYYYELDNKSEDSDKTISIVVDKDTKKITEISINYNLEKAMEEMDIIAFD